MKLVHEVVIQSELVINGVVMNAIDTVTMRGLETMASCLGSPFNYTKAWMPYVGLGQGENAPSTENLHLETEKYRIEAAVTYNLNWYLAAAVFEIDTAFILREVGMFDALQGGNMAARWLLADDINVAVDDIVDVTCRLYIT